MRRPYAFALTLAGAAIGGFVGMMLVEGAWTWPFMALACGPAGLAASGHFRRSRAR